MPLFRSIRVTATLVGLGVLAVLGLVLNVPLAEAKPDETSAVRFARKSAAVKPARCVRQKPQNFLIRASYLHQATRPASLRKPGRVASLGRAVQYRLDEYGAVPGLGEDEPSGALASDAIEPATFMGLPIQLHHRVIPALKCVEAELMRTCRQNAYQPRAIGGYRNYNSMRGGEVSNHAFGIAVDIDPELNPCCGCVDPWPENPRCKTESRSIYERMAMPRCWVRVFERYGFYWLGHDQLQDTMHFEFLGDPDRLDGARGRHQRSTKK